ncbi:MAG: signal peptidase I [Epsilonproteobacteria bacterium]|nr:MAG: signal peptidase I [Campylobacterota bacterium]RLA67170.1 MAG: signal peptidase I [Campylobacterota bacterium]
MKKNRPIIYIVLPMVMVLGLHITQGPGWFNNLFEDKTTYRGLASVDLMEAFDIDEGGLRELDFTRNRAFKIPSLYMYPNYFFEDVLTVTTDPRSVCIQCQGGIRPGEVVAFRFPGNNKKIGFGRVLGFPGDEIEIKNKEIFINGQVEELAPLQNGNSKINLINFAYFKSNIKGIVYVIVKDPDKKEKTSYQLQKIPPGHFYILADNRDHSIDSRALGPIPLGRIIGVEIGMSNQTRVEKTLSRLKPRD